MIALIDADVLCYRASAVAVSEIDWDGDGEISPLHNLPLAKQVAEQLIKDWTKAARCKRYLLVFSDRSAPKTSFRYHICPTYKTKRPDEKPPLHDEIFNYLQANHKHVELPGLEGDDTLGLMGTGEGGSHYVVVSIDKDMLTLPVRQVNPDIKGIVPRKLSLREADYNWMYQTICGDQVDNYKGAPGAGPKRAQSALALKKNATDMWHAALGVFADQYDKPNWGDKFVHETAFDEALMNARCARILRHGEYNSTTKEVRLWHPHPEDREWISPF